jgi:hypothetical protein
MPPTQAASVDDVALKVEIIITRNSPVPERTAEQTPGIVVQVSTKPMTQEMSELAVSLGALFMPSSPPTKERAWEGEERDVLDLGIHEEPEKGGKARRCVDRPHRKNHSRKGLREGKAKVARKKGREEKWDREVRHESRHKSSKNQRRLCFYSFLAVGIGIREYK